MTIYGICIIVMKIVENEFLWAQKYRPQTIDECVLTPRLREIFNGFVQEGDFVNMTLSGPKGCGKTTVARALSKQLDFNFIQINGSDAKESGIDALRMKIRNFASSKSLNGKPKVVIFDEADYLNAHHVQPSLRGFIEEFSKNCRFILTCNFKHRLIEPILSRCPDINFEMTEDERIDVMKKIFVRMRKILSHEEVSFEDNVLAELVKLRTPDFRRILNDSQTYTRNSHELNYGVLSGVTDDSFDSLMQAIKEKKFKAMRQWVVDNSDLDTSLIFRRIYDTMFEHVEHTSIPELVIAINEYQYKDNFVRDKEINLVAFFVTIMNDMEFRQ